jgi:hypothetical protein
MDMPFVASSQTLATCPTGACQSENEDKRIVNQSLPQGTVAASDQFQLACSIWHRVANAYTVAIATLAETGSNTFRDPGLGRSDEPPQLAIGSVSILGKPLPVKPASHARIGFDIPAPRGAQLIIEHLCVEQLLARECRPLSAGDTALEIKTHPEASHIACALRAGDQAIKGVQFDVDCGQCIEPTARNFIVIGAMKAGTTTLFELLAQHPALCRTWAELPGVSSTKEINYFRNLYRDDDSQLHYDWRFPFDPARHAWTLEASPGYTKWPASKSVPARIASLGGNTRLAYILREPIDRIESHLAHMLYNGRNIKRIKHCIRASSYALQLDKFIAHIERNDILLLDFEQLRQDPLAILEQISDFLGIDRIDSQSVIHNKRGIDFQLDASRRAEITEALRPDVQRLISVYGFKPAEAWLPGAT